MSYKEEKISNDKDVAYYLMQRMCEKRTDSDAYMSEVMDGMGTFDTTNENKKWAFTMLDNIVNTIKTEIGDERCLTLFNNFKDLSYFDSVFIEEKGHDYSYPKSVKALNKIASKYNSLTYLPNGMTRNDEYIDDRKFTKELIRESLTFVSYLLSVLVNKEEVGEHTFNSRVKPIVEDTFGFMSSDSYENIHSAITSSNFVIEGKLTPEALQLLSDLCKLLDDNGIYLVSDDRGSNYSKYIKTLSAYGE